MSQTAPLGASRSAKPTAAPTAAPTASAAASKADDDDDETVQSPPPLPHNIAIKECRQRLHSGFLNTSMYSTDYLEHPDDLVQAFVVLRASRARAAEGQEEGDKDSSDDKSKKASPPASDAPSSDQQPKVSPTPAAQCPAQPNTPAGTRRPSLPSTEKPQEAPAMQAPQAASQPQEDQQDVIMLDGPPPLQKADESEQAKQAQNQPRKQVSRKKPQKASPQDPSPQTETQQPQQQGREARQQEPRPAAVTTRLSADDNFYRVMPRLESNKASSTKATAAAVTAAEATTGAAAAATTTTATTTTGTTGGNKKKKTFVYANTQLSNGLSLESLNVSPRGTVIVPSFPSQEYMQRMFSIDPSFTPPKNSSKNAAPAVPAAADGDLLGLDDDLPALPTSIETFGPGKRKCMSTCTTPRQLGHDWTLHDYFYPPQLDRNDDEQGWPFSTDLSNLNPSDDDEIVLPLDQPAEDAAFTMPFMEQDQAGVVPPPPPPPQEVFGDVVPLQQEPPPPPQPQEGERTRPAPLLVPKANMGIAKPVEVATAAAITRGKNQKTPPTTRKKRYQGLFIKAARANRVQRYEVPPDSALACIPSFDQSIDILSSQIYERLRCQGEVEFLKSQQEQQEHLQHLQRLQALYLKDQADEAQQGQEAPPQEAQPHEQQEEPPHEQQEEPQEQQEEPHEQQEEQQEQQEESPEEPSPPKPARKRQRQQKKPQERRQPQPKKRRQSQPPKRQTRKSEAQEAATTPQPHPPPQSKRHHATPGTPPLWPEFDPGYE